MTTQDYPILELPTKDYDGDGVDETPRFEFQKNHEITPGIRRGFLVGGGEGAINSVVSNYLEQSDRQFQSFFVGLGIGQKVYDLQFEATAGDDARWGATGNGGEIADATGGDRMEKIAVLDRCLSVASTDSLTPARLEWGGYAPGALFDDAAIGNEDHLDIMIGNVDLPKSTDESSTFGGSMEFVTTVPADEILDAVRRTNRDSA